MTFEQIKQQLTPKVRQALELPEDTPVIFEYPDSQFGDLAIPCFPFARILRMAPPAIAAKLSERLVDEHIQECSVVSGYVNLRLNIAQMLESVAHTPQSATAHKVVVEFASPNTNKPLHLGHMRNIMIGESMSSLYRLLGNQVVKTEIFNDRGIAIAKMMLIYDRFHHGEEPTGKSDHFAGSLYVEFEQRVREDETLEAEAQNILKAWEDGDEYWYGVWKKLRDWVIAGQRETYNRIGTSFDEEVYESDIYTQGKELVMDGFERGVLYKDSEKGYIYADLEDQGMPNKILIRSNGTALYITQDIALLQYRLYGDSLCRDADKLIYVTDFAQNLQFQQLFAIAKILGLKGDGLYHIGYGAIRRPEGKMSSRKGNVVNADDLITMIEDLVREQFFGDSELSEAEQERRIRIIADSSYKYYLVATSAKKDMIFDESASVSLDGKTGPYILYTYARIQSLIRKSEVTPEISSDYDFDSERELITFALRYPEIVQAAGDQFDPAILAQYLYELAEKLNSYYHATPVVGSDPHIEGSRVYLLAQISDMLKQGLAVFGIETLDEM